MKLQKGDASIELKNSRQIAAYKRAGWEAAETEKAEGKPTGTRKTGANEKINDK